MFYLPISNNPIMYRKEKASNYLAASFFSFYLRKYFSKITNMHNAYCMEYYPFCIYIVLVLMLSNIRFNLFIYNELS
jgi:hypothetical protein